MKLVVYIFTTDYMFMSQDKFEWLRFITYFFRSAELASILPSDNKAFEIFSNDSNEFTSDEILMQEYDKYCLGKSYFECKEFTRAALYLKDCKSKLCRFLYFYSRYLVRIFNRSSKLK